MGAGWNQSRIQNREMGRGRFQLRRHRLAAVRSGFLITVGVLSAVWTNSHGDDIEVVSKTREVSSTVSSIADSLEPAAVTEQISPEKSVTNTSGEIVLNPPSANANLWLTNSPPVNEYRSVSAGKWLSH